jgi:hypothetical protein
VAPGLYEAELRYLCDQEWARSADDVLWRRTKLGLHYSCGRARGGAVVASAHRPGARMLGPMPRWSRMQLTLNDLSTRWAPPRTCTRWT